ncbi:hypothetical protein PIB30_043188 [Stylosanthes scabra]|uniref:CCHC-type domain-containing protein n=1 Tax=Stylosanthes scabra TaxID=79078 RepID=A0ABU6VG70_9FABA|nr:hypothetical protein [Stylosanthes scabra]
MAIAPLEIRDFSSLVSKCQVIEDCTKKLEVDRSEVLKGKQMNQEPFQQPHQKKLFQRTPATDQTEQTLIDGSNCPSCGKLHKGKCLAGQNVCFRCFQPGHFAKECPTDAATPNTQVTAFPGSIENALGEASPIGIWQPP